MDQRRWLLGVASALLITAAAIGLVDAASARGRASNAGRDVGSSTGTDLVVAAPCGGGNYMALNFTYDNSAERWPTATEALDQMLSRLLERYPEPSAHRLSRRPDPHQQDYWSVNGPDGVVNGIAYGTESAPTFLASVHATSEGYVVDGVMLCSSARQQFVTKRGSDDER